MTIKLDFKPYPKYKPSKSGQTICITNFSTVEAYDYSKKYDAFNAQDDLDEALVRQLNHFVVGFCEVDDEQFVGWINKLNEENEEVE